MKKYWRDTKHHRDSGMDADIIRGISLGMDAILWPMGEKQRLLATLEGGNVMCTSDDTAVFRRNRSDVSH